MSGKAVVSAPDAAAGVGVGGDAGTGMRRASGVARRARDAAARAATLRESKIEPKKNSTARRPQ